MRQKLEGYFTVEAAMVLPVVLLINLFIMYLWFFQYNRCLLEQDVGSLALRGVSLQVDNNEERIRRLRELTDEVYREKYIAWESEAVELRLGQGSIQAKQSGSLRLPIVLIGGGKQVMGTTATYKNHIVSPVLFIRTCRKVIGG